LHSIDPTKQSVEQVREKYVTLRKYLVLVQNIEKYVKNSSLKIHFIWKWIST